MSDERRDDVVRGVHEPAAASAAHPVHRLTRSERRVLSLVAQGKRNKDVANQLFVSVNTVKTHLQHIFKKLDVSNRREASQAYRDVLRRYI
jgi:DNA-binding NarL/FixJ family response regulator